MRGDQDLIKLYSGQILALAAAIPNTTRLVNPDATIRKRSPLCGSTVVVDVKVDAGTIVGFGQDVRACALGQAAASVIGANAIGCTLPQIEQARDQLRAMLLGANSLPDAPFDALSVLQPAREFKNRHASIMLAIEALAEAFSMTTKTTAPDMLAAKKTPHPH